MTVKAVYEDGVFKPKEPVALEDHAEVELEIRSTTPRSEEDDPTGWKTADELIGFIKDGPKGPIGEEHDRYLYRK
jgi:predicted DNA-binding antitoxin AbrB/MazE fold protein